MIRQAFFNYNPLFHVVIIAFRLLGISPVSVPAIAAIVTFSLVHYHSLHPGQRVQNFLTACKIAFILLFVVAGFGLGQGDPSRPDLPRPYRTFGYPFTPLLFIAGNLWVVVFTISSRPLVGAAGVLTIGIGVALYFLLNKQSDDSVASCCQAGEL